MAVFQGSTSTGGGDHTPLGTLVKGSCDWTVSGGDVAILVGLAFSATDLKIFGIPLNDNSLSNLSRTVTYRGVKLASLGVQPWGSQQAWTEVFGAVGVAPGPGTLTAQVYGGGASVRYMRYCGQSWTGVDSIGTPVMATGTTTTIAVSSTAAASGRIAEVAGAGSGLSGMSTGSSPYPALYVQNTGIGLLIGDAQGTGSTQSVTATKQNIGQWGAFAVPLQPADTVATCELLRVEPLDIAPVVRTRPRTGGLARQTFTA